MDKITAMYFSSFIKFRVRNASTYKIWKLDRIVAHFYISKAVGLSLAFMILCFIIGRIYESLYDQNMIDLSERKLYKVTKGIPVKRVLIKHKSKFDHFNIT